MRRLILCIISIILINIQWPIFAFTVTEQEASQILIDLGFENVKVRKNNNTMYVALEDNIYRGTYRGYGIALNNLTTTDKHNTEIDTIVLVALDNQMPKLQLTALYSGDGGWNLKADYVGSETMHYLKDIKQKNSSLGKLDFVIHPHITLQNYVYTQLWEAAIDISPALEINLWKGASATVQVAIPLWNNFIYDENYRSLHPGYMSFTQQLFSNQWAEASVSVGIFSQNRNGVDLRGTVHINKALDFGLIAGYTGGWYVESGKWHFCELDRFNLLARIDYYEKYSNCQVQLIGGQFVYGDFGARLNISRHLADFNLGIFGTMTEGENDLGFYFSIPLSGKKMPRHNRVRVRLPESISWEQSMFNYGDYLHNHRGVMYRTTSNQDLGEKYWQPQYVEEYVLKYLKDKIK